MKISVEELVTRSQELIIEFDGKNCFREDARSDHQWYYRIGMELEQILHEKQPHFEKREFDNLICALYELSAREGNVNAAKRLKILGYSIADL